MALEVKSKKGGPYTKQQQEKRRKQVYELHFERGFSAVSIANEIDVNRNTINEDIKYWMMQIASQFEDQSSGRIVLNYVERQENQRRRLLEQLDKAEFKEKLQIEKLLFDMEFKMINVVSKIEIKKTPIVKESKIKISIEDALQILKDIVLSEDDVDLESISENEIVKKIMVLKHCEEEYASAVYSEFCEMDLEIFTDEYEDDYDLVYFVKAKGILSSEESKMLEHKIKEN